MAPTEKGARRRLFDICGNQSCVHLMGTRTRARLLLRAARQGKEPLPPRVCIFGVDVEARLHVVPRGRVDGVRRDPRIQSTSQGRSIAATDAAVKSLRHIEE